MDHSDDEGDGTFDLSTLKTKLIALSQSNTWSTAIQEWSLNYIHDLRGSGSPGKTCLCGKRPILELCYIINNFNANTALVGNVCIKKFGKSNPLSVVPEIFESFKKIRKIVEKKEEKKNNKNNNTKKKKKRRKKEKDRSLTSASAELIQYAFEHDIIRERDWEFYMDVRTYEVLTKRQKDWKYDLNKKIVNAIKGIVK